MFAAKLNSNPTINHFFLLKSYQDFEKAKIGRQTNQHKAPLAKENVLIVDKQTQIKN